MISAKDLDYNIHHLCIYDKEKLHKHHRGYEPVTKLRACFLMAAMLVFPAAWADGADNAVILLYHHVSDSTPASTSVTPGTFEQHLQYLADGYNVISLEQAIDQLKSAKPLRGTRCCHYL